MKVSGALALCIVLLASACGESGAVHDPAKAKALTPAASDFTIITVDWHGQKCDIAYVYLEHNGSTQYGTGGPAMANLGCYKP